MSARDRISLKRGGAAVGVWAVGVWLASASAARADDLAGFTVDLLATVSTWLTTHASGILSTAYDRAPVLVTVLAAMLILPVTALALLLTQSIRLRLHAAQPRDAGNARQTAALLTPPPSAVLVDADGRVARLPRGSAAVRIGRHDDNDIRFSVASVHRHHAVIHRLVDGAFTITDVSGTTGNGIRINGERVTDARLRAGDRIDLGEVALTFDVASSSFVASSASHPS